ncbi:uncharacterized protein LOC131675950 [Topomyia yanbarensis]|uniref:uncharacterized protein LOC131675950 n=1 Tax=Topomyia yanbarensis TaxID=2498891 RepID=UPI00273AB3A0|nr:uncharacterized protein LOC131675950 [Topomyia yanbarensis]
MAQATPELMEALSEMIAQALKASIGSVVQQAPVFNLAGEPAAPSPKVPTFTMSEFRSGEESSVSDYFNRFEWVLQLSRIPQNQYANYARVHLGAELNKALKFLVSPNDPAETTYEDLRTTLTDHFDRAKNKFVESIKFRQIVQQKDEAVAQFVLRLKQGAADCEYGDFLDRMLIEQFLHGLEARDMCDEIIAKNPATFKAAYEVAHTLEATRNTAREVNAGTPSANVEGTNKLGYETPRMRKFSRRASPPHQKPHLHQQGPSDEKLRSDRHHDRGSSSCNGCGGQHMRNQCRFRDARCNKCNKTGHIARVCRSARSTFQNDATDQIQSSENPASEVDVVQILGQV